MSSSPLAFVLHAVPAIWQLIAIPSILQLSLCCKSIKNTVDMILLSCERWKHSSLVLNGRTRKDLADICNVYQFGGYCIPFKVNDSPNLLEINYSTGLFQESTFEMKNQCKWTGFEDTFRMHFSNVEFGEEKIAPPEYVAERFRKFSNPLLEPGFLLNKVTLDSIGMLLPGNTTYIARWVQLPVFSDTERRQIFEKSINQMSYLNDPHPGYRRNMPVTHDCAGYLYIPGAIFPDPVTRKKVTEWANDECVYRLWHTPWKQCPKTEFNVWLQDDMKAKYGNLGVTYTHFHLRSEEEVRRVRNGQHRDISSPSILPKFSRESMHWPKLHQIVSTQPMDKINEETVSMYMKLLQEKGNECCRPTVILLKMKAAAHLDVVYFILDGHHKLIAMQRLVEKQKKESSISRTLITNRRLNFFIIQCSEAWDGNLDDGSDVNVEISRYGYPPYFYDDYNGLIEHFSKCKMEKVDGCVKLPIVVVKKALQYKAAIQVLHDGFQVASVVGDLIATVIGNERHRLAESRKEKYKVIQKIASLRDELASFINNDWFPSLPAINWKTNPILNAGEEHFTKREKKNKWFEANNPRWYDFTINELESMLGTLVDTCKANDSLEGLLLKLGKLEIVDSSGSKPPEADGEPLDLSLAKPLFGDDY